MNTSTQTKTVVIGILRKDMAQFGIKESELTERIGVIWDTEHFNTKEDHSVWLQSKDKAPNVCEVYFDDVWMCDLYDDDTHTVFKVKFYRGFLKAYEKGTIRLNRAVMLAEQEAKEAAKKQAKKELEASIKALPEVTPEDKASKEIIKEMAKEEETNAQVSV